MFKFSDVLCAHIGAMILSSLLISAVHADERYAGIGRPATPAEIKAWNIDVRPDFVGLPKGSGSVEHGQDVWESKCASCHGTFGESNKVFTPLIGGISKEDLQTGHVATLKRTDFPARTTFMKVATISTVFDYIRRAMPWNAPKSLSDDDVYAVLAYLLNLSDIVSDDFVLDEKTIKDVQKIMPNRNGMTTEHALWPSANLTHGKKINPDTHNIVCMKDCKKEPEIASTLPDYALSSHGNLADQNRHIGPVRGQVTAASVPTATQKTPLSLAESAGCLGCHAVATHVVGPSYAEIADKYRGKDVVTQLYAKVRQGGQGVWGDVAMPAQEEIKDDDLKVVINWILATPSSK
jgi:S-disulfanyl-L-cysteine oxidoreductase SoxD